MDMNSNTAVVNEMEREDRIFDDPDAHIKDEQDEKIEDNQLKLVTAEDDQNVESDQMEIEPSEEIKPGAEENEFETLDTLIEQLPEHFPAAPDIIRNEIAPILANCDPGVVDHYITTIKKKTKAESKRAVTLIIDEAIKQQDSQVVETDEDAPDETPVDPEITALAEQIAQDPMLIKERINLVNQLGVIGEQKTIGLYTLVLDSALLPLGSGSSEALAAKNSGPYGAGKSYPLFVTLKIYPKSAYRLITNGSAKSLYNLKDGLKHKALILTEALSLQGTKGDNELAYTIRSLVSEGQLTYQYTGFEDKEKVTITQKLEGPTSLLTTTIRGKLEEQLEDRLVQIHPNSSDKQTQAIISQTAEIASGMLQPVDEKVINAWKHFYRSLDSVDVVIPFAPDISNYVAQSGALPLSARRAFKRVISGIKTIALLHQFQREKDEYGRIVAEMSDYAIAYQLMKDAFLEGLGREKRYTDRRLELIYKEGIITAKRISEMTGVTGAAISQWLKSLINKGILAWCDEEGEEFPDVKLLEKAKRSGKAFIKVANFNRLPTPFELTGNPDWDIDGELYRQYDLGFESTDTDVLDLDECEQSSFSLNTSADSNDVENKEETEDSTEGVKALRSIPHKDVMKMVAELKENQKECDPKDPEFIKFQNDLARILTPDNVSAMN